LADCHEIWYGGHAIQGDLYAVTFNPIFSTILKWLKFEIVGGMIFSLSQQWFGIV
jgi:hypothetical protein